MSIWGPGIKFPVSNGSCLRCRATKTTGFLLVVSLLVYCFLKFLSFIPCITSSTANQSAGMRLSYLTHSVTVLQLSLALLWIWNHEEINFGYFVSIAESIKTCMLSNSAQNLSNCDSSGWCGYSNSHKCFWWWSWPKVNRFSYEMFWHFGLLQPNCIDCEVALYSMYNNSFL